MRKGMRLLSRFNFFLLAAYILRTPWRNKLLALAEAALCPNPNACRAPRLNLFSLRMCQYSRISKTCWTMQHLSMELELNMKLASVPMPNVKQAYHHHHYHHQLCCYFCFCRQDLTGSCQYSDRVTPIASFFVCLHCIWL